MSSAYIDRFQPTTRRPERGRVRLLLMAIDYVHNEFGLQKTQFANPELGLKKDTLSNAKSGTMSPHDYSNCCRVLYDFLALTERGANEGEIYYRRIAEIDDWMVEPMVRLFPEFKSVASIYHGGFDRDKSAYVNMNVKALEKVRDLFSRGAYIFRFAANRGVIDEENIRLARGVLEVDQELQSFNLTFSLSYHFKDLSGQLVDRGVRGVIYLVGAYIFFEGYEKANNYPFFMIMNYNTLGSEFGGLILRKHHDKGYFASRTIVLIRPDGDEGQKGAGIVELHDEPLITEIHINQLRNKTSNNDYGVLFLTGKEPFLKSKAETAQ